MFRDIKIEAIENNSKYKLINYKDEYYLMDLNGNKITYIFPLLNYLTKHKLMRIDKDELYEIKKSAVSKAQLNKRKVLGGFGAAIGILIAKLTKSFVDYLDFSGNLLLKIFLVVIGILPVFIIKEIVNHKKRREIDIKITRPNFKAFVLPNNKDLFKNIFKNIFIYILLYSFIYASIVMEESNIIFIICVIVMLSLLLSLNVTLYSHTKIKGKIGKIKER
ncbi:DUF443 family protein [Staphylococcus argensis]|uniref:DUF443 domain-containing protein n=1 Tax=Staphylococcus argensis TaxID=1607738 RepID=A0A2K4FCM4_9STAP|nr:DUF443 family protein [Staphylococcus argensis]MCY6991647.1 DUF443 family protein [Staphylococcus argensis]POA09037.1 hypothetical protein CD039_08630 [Staphylococcus argensis]